MWDSTATWPRPSESSRRTRRSFVAASHSGGAIPRGGSGARASLPRGLQARLAYTYSKLHNNGAESAQGNNAINGGVQNPAEPLEWSLSADYTARVSDRLHLAGARAVVRPCRSRARRLERGGPSPLRKRTAAEHCDEQRLAGLLFNTEKRPNTVGGADPVARRGEFDPFTDNYFNRNAWSDPGPLQFGNAPKRDGDVRGFPTFSEDVKNLQGVSAPGADANPIEAQIGNLFNRVVFCDPNTDWSAPGFGTVNTQCNTPRSIQFGARLEF